MIRIVKLFILASMFVLETAWAQEPGYNYEKRKVDDHVIHIVTINSKHYITTIVKANDGNGRETVPSMAERSNAEIAINGGFFGIGNKSDGMPSGTLVINGHVYKMKDKIQPLVVIDLNNFSIIKANPKNYVLNDVSIVSGIPYLINDSKISHDLFEKTGEFYVKAHARTAIGIKPNSDIIIVVAEHSYLKDLTSITAGEVQSLINEKGKIFVQKYNHKNPSELTLKELKEILKEEYTSKDGMQGITILELAELMKELGCQYALNLDGGGSSTLWIDGKVINHTIGDADEGNSLSTIRPVSDAIIFKRK